MTDETSVVAEWITYTLTTAFANASGTAPVVYEGIAPVDAVEPYVVFAFVTAPSVNTISGDTVMVRPYVDVQAVCEGGSFSPLTPIATAIQTALHGKRYQSTDDGSVFSCTRTDSLRYTEATGGKVYRHLGATYRIESQGE